MKNWFRTYLYCVAIQQIFYLVMAVITPVYFTVGLYYWTVFFLVMLILSAYELGKHLEKTTNE